jgi:hypothetical protein
MKTTLLISGAQKRPTFKQTRTISRRYKLANALFLQSIYLFSTGNSASRAGRQLAHAAIPARLSA